MFRDGPTKPHEFFRSVALNSGVKMDAETDGVEALCHHLAVRRAAKTMTGMDNLDDLLGKAINAYERWKRGDMLKISKRSTSASLHCSAFDKLVAKAMTMKGLSSNGRA